MQCKNYVRDRKAGTSHSWDETLQPTHPWNQWEQMDRSGREDDEHHEGVASSSRKVSRSAWWSGIQSTAGLEKWDWKGDTSTQLSSNVTHQKTTVRKTARTPFTNSFKQNWRTHHVHEMKMVMGDLNAKVGNRNCERAMGREGCGTMNDNGERLLDTCTTYDFVIGRTLFPHRDVHKLTWYSPNGRDKNYIDHLMINGMCRQSLPNVRVRRWAAVWSDHHLVTITLKLKLRKTRSSPRGRRHFDVDKLRELKVKTAFILQLNN